MSSSVGKMVARMYARPTHWPANIFTSLTGICSLCPLDTKPRNSRAKSANNTATRCFIPLPPEPVPEAVPPMIELIGHPAVQVAHAGLTAGEEHLGRDHRAVLGGAEPGSGVDARGRDAGGRLEGAGGIGGRDALHEVRPDGRSRRGPAQSEGPAIVEAYPYQG